MGVKVNKRMWKLMKASPAKLSEKELNAMLDYQMSLTAEQRYELMDKLVKEEFKRRYPNGPPKEPRIIVRDENNNIEKKIW